MRWETVSNSAFIEVYNLFEGEKKLMTLTIHPLTNTARLESNAEKRVFQLRQEGFFKNKTVLRNEYGMKMGEVRNQNGDSQIELEGELFHYSINEKDAPEMVIYKDTANRPTAVCKLKPENGTGSMKFNTQGTKRRSAATSLLMALCWYILVPAKAAQSLDLVL